MKRIEILIDEANPDKKIGISYNKNSFENNEEVLAVLLGSTIGFVKENVPNNNKVLYLQVCIGTMILKNKIAYVQAGAGIVYDSIAQNEYQETINKAKSMTRMGELRP